MKKLNDSVLAEGEVTGHAHRLPSCVDVYETPTVEREFLTPVEVDLTHEEHKTVTLPPGEYVSDKVVEYDHFAEEARKVTD